MARILELIAANVRMIDHKLHDRWNQILHLEEEVMELTRQKRDKHCPKCGRKSLKRVVGAPRIERGTATMSRSKKGGKRTKNQRVSKVKS
jgi:ribosomal protein L37AE/L43A